MADGMGCRCAARSEGECCCNVDWTPSELVKLREDFKQLAHIANNLLVTKRAEERAIRDWDKCREQFKHDDSAERKHLENTTRASKQAMQQLENFLKERGKF